MKPLYTKTLLFAALAAAAVLGLRFVLPIALPFLLALSLALAAEPAVSLLQGRLRLPRSVAAGIGVSAVFLLTATLLTLVLTGLLRQLPRLSSLIPQIEDTLLSTKNMVEARLLTFADGLPGSFGLLLGQWTRALFSGGQELTSPLLQRIPQLITGLAGKMSQGLFGTLTGLIASFMVSARLPQLRRSLVRRLPEGFPERLKTAKKRLKAALGSWFLAQCKLAAITFGVLWAGFFLLRISPSLQLALVITLVDAFPVLGVGTVLVPWACICFLQSQTAKGVGLLSIYAVAWLLRSTLEPKLVGSSLGLDPLLTLACIYVGLKLGGILGMLLAPMLAMLALQLWQAWK